MNNKLIVKFIIGFVIIILGGFLFTSIFVSSLTRNRILQQEAEKMYQEATYLAEGYGKEYYLGNEDDSSLSNQMNIISNYTGCKVMLISRNGDIVAGTENISNYGVAAFDPTDTGNKYYMINRFYNIFDEDHLIVMYPITYNYAVSGYVILAKSISVIASELYGIFNYNYVTLIAAVLLMGIFVFIFIRNVSKPIEVITESTGRLAKGDFSEKINMHRNDEIGRLAASLDYMASEIGSLTDYQRKFIANVSHDFRSPLTSIKGYLEAMMDGTIPSEMQEKYFNIVINETERLTKLTNNMLTISNVNDKGLPLDLTDFDIIQIIKQTINTFEGTCSKKKIMFKLVFCDSSVTVRADKGKIQQVIYNLVDNAIKFSNNDSSIIISVSERNDKILTSIKDFGIGIPKDSIPKIWDRFYKSDLSRGKDKRGTGLGLSIVKDIINAHGEYIDVISTEGVGTEFIFALPAVNQ